jgi:RimJ/RimL family protein N-acetyltransferase
MASSIETDRLSLRPRDEADAAGNLELRQEHGDSTPRSLAEEERHLAELRTQAEANGFGLLTIWRRDESDAIGYAGLIVGRSSVDEPEIAYELLQRAHGHGYATEAARAVLDAAFATGRRRVWATLRSWNAASFRVLDKLAFRRHHSTVDADGEVVWMLRDLDDAP